MAICATYSTGNSCLFLFSRCAYLRHIPLHLIDTFSLTPETPSDSASEGGSPAVTCQSLSLFLALSLSAECVCVDVCACTSFLWSVEAEFLNGYGLGGTFTLI